LAVLPEKKGYHKGAKNIRVRDSMCAACIQMCSVNNVSANLEMAGQLLADAVSRGVELAVLPENFSFMGADEAEKRAVAEPEVSSKVLDFLASQAKAHGMAIVGGSVTLTAKESGRLRNACPVFSARGERVALYDKMHLFDADLPGEAWCESDIVEAGAHPVTCDIGDWRLGLSICYDLRFPELYRYYSREGCNLLPVPAAFTVQTGKAHWETLLRARAIENQCYVFAATQNGTHPGGRKTWGHSMIIDPWGEVLSVCTEPEGIVSVDIDMGRVNEVRQMLPAINHRRM